MLAPFSRSLAGLLVLSILAAYSAAADDKNISVEDVFRALSLRQSSVENGRVVFDRRISIPERKNMERSSFSVSSTGATPPVKKIADQEALDAISHHVMTFLGDDLVRVDMYDVNAADSPEPYALHSVTQDWGDERRITPAREENSITRDPGQKGRRFLEPAISNGQDFVAGLQLIVQKSGVALADILTVERIERDGEERILIRTKADQSLRPPLPSIEVDVDPSKDFFIERVEYWTPSKDLIQSHTRLDYIDPIQNDAGIWYATSVSETTWNGDLKTSANPVGLSSEWTYIISSFEANLPDIDINELFDRTIQPGRTVIDRIVDPSGKYMYEQSDLADLTMFLDAQGRVALDAQGLVVEEKSTTDPSPPVAGGTTVRAENGDPAKSPRWKRLVFFVAMPVGLALIVSGVAGVLRRRKSGK